MRWGPAVFLSALLLLAAGKTWQRYRSAVVARDATGVAELERAAEIDETAAELWFEMGRAYQRHPAVRDERKAVEYLQRAVALNPFRWGYRWELARALDCPLDLSIDPERLRRVVINVVENATQAMTAGEDAPAKDGVHRLSISTCLARARAELRVADTGPGMDEETLQKIFEPLFSTKSFGVGLGLTVVKQIMEQHGGGIEIESTPGQGTEVMLWLPLSDPHGGTRHEGAQP